MRVSDSPLRVAAAGGDPNLSTWLDDVGKLPGILSTSVNPAADLSPETFSSADLWLLGGSVEQRYRLAAEAIRASRHVFLIWPPVVGSEQCRSLARLADEAGVLAGTNRPFFGSSLLRDIPARSTVSQISISINTSGDHTRNDVIDLCHLLAGGSPVKHIWATRNDPGSSLIALRFQNNLAASITLRVSSNLPDTVYLAGNGFSLDGTISHSRIWHWNQAGERPGVDGLLEFVAAIREDRRTRLSISDTVETFRTIEHIRERLGQHG
jgi:predicted dehydrogenase